MTGKAKIVEHVAATVEGLSKKRASEVVDAILEEIVAKLAEGERVQLPGLGTFVVAERPTRAGRNPATGQEILIPARRAVRFKASATLAASLSGNPTTRPRRLPRRRTTGNPTTRPNKPTKKN